MKNSKFEVSKMYMFLWEVFFDPSNEEHGRESCLGDHLTPSPTNNCEEVGGNKAYKSENVKISNQFK